MNKKFIFFLIILSFFFSILFSTPLAYAADPVVTQSYELNTPIGGIKEFNVSQGSNDILGKYVKAWYGFLLGIVGILAAVVIIFAGVRWMISRGNSSETGQAKEMMVSAISGLVLALLAYTILYLINPTLVVIKMPALDPLYTESGLGEESSEEGEGTGRAGSAGNSASIDELTPEAQALHRSIVETCGPVTANSTYRPANRASAHYSRIAIDYPRTTAMDNCMNGIINGVEPYTRDKQGNPIYRVTFPNGASGRIIDEPGNNCWHIDLRP